MKHFFLYLGLIIVPLQLFAQNDSAKIQTTITDSIVYTCSMHPEVISDKPGKCPKCGMDLVQKNSSSSEHKMDMMDMMMMCPMHGMVDMNHKHDDKKKNNMKMMKGVGIAMVAMMVVMMTMMIIIIGGH